MNKDQGIPANIDTTEINIFSTDWTGDQRSKLDSYILGSSPGGCKIEIHTSPFT